MLSDKDIQKAFVDCGFASEDEELSPNAYRLVKKIIKAYQSNITKTYKMNFEIWHGLPSYVRLNYLEFMHYHDKWPKGQSNVFWRGQTIYKAQFDWIKKNIGG